MRELIISDHLINDEHPYFIAEIGHNHGGDIQKCREMIAQAARSGADAVKLQKRDNRKLFTKSTYDKPYDNENSYGATYGEHREALEFDKQTYQDLQDTAEKYWVDLFATAFDFSSADLLASIDVPAFKVASGDLSNIPLIEYLTKFDKPIIISTGGGTYQDIMRVDCLLQSLKFQNYAFLHCVAMYPAPASALNLRCIERMRELFPKTVIGWSSHYSGPSDIQWAYERGARIFEKHFTLRHEDKGTDHKFSMEPAGFALMKHYMTEMIAAQGNGEKTMLEDEAEPIRKMSKSVYAARPIKAGKIITLDDVVLKSPGGGLQPYELWSVIGKTALCDIDGDQDMKGRYE